MHPIAEYRRLLRYLYPGFVVYGNPPYLPAPP